MSIFLIEVYDLLVCAIGYLTFRDACGLVILCLLLVSAPKTAQQPDSEIERRALRTRVYPKLREYCRHIHGLEFQVLDGYDGIHVRDFYSSTVRKVRMELLKDCVRSSAGPCFVALIGEEYGEPCLPTQIECEEFEKILLTAEEHGVCTKVLETCYLRDENGCPPVYQILKTEETFQSSSPHCFHEASHHLRTMFETLVPLCVQEGILEPQQAEKYFNSALEDELMFALQDSPPDLLDRCICYIHKVPYKAFQKQNERTTGDTYGKLCHIRDTLLPSLAGTGGLRVYSTTTTCNNKVGYTKEKQQQYVDGLCRQFYDDMIALIKCKVPKNQVYRKKRNEEAMQHLSLCRMYSELQWYECKETETIRKYIMDESSKKPLVVIGESCSGKTVLLASCAKKIHNWLKDSNAALLVRFAHQFTDTMSLGSLMSGLCHQLADIFQKDISTQYDDVNKLRECFVELLSASSKKRPVILIIDAIDQVTYDGNLQTFWWIPVPVPEFTKIIVSVTKERSKECDIVKLLHQNQILLLEVKPTRKECNDTLRLKLLENKRRITSGQQMYVNKSLESHTSPMQMLLLYKEVMGWKSHQDIDDYSIGEDMQDIITRLFHKLEVKYGYQLVSRVLSYISLSRSGIGEAELVDLLSSDDMVLAQLYPLDQMVGILRVPDWIVANILLDLQDCLSQRVMTSCRLVCWTNCNYQQVVIKLYLSSQELIHKLHTNVCHYFTGRWAYGRAKLMSIKQMNQPLYKDPMPNLHTVAPKIYVDRQLPSQPWFFNGQSSHQNTSTGNIRKAYELPFHLTECGKLDDLYNKILIVLPYYKVLLNSGQLHALTQNIDKFTHLTGRKEIYFICDILKETECLLKENPDTLDMVMKAKIMPILSAYPELLKIMKQVYQDDIRMSPIVLQHSPLVEVPVISLFQHNDLVEIMKLTADGEFLITSVASGDLYVWETTTGENIHHIQSDPVSQLLITPNGNFVVSLCQNGISRVWKPLTGNTICTIHVCLSQAAITPESTFIIGLHEQGLLAVSLWSGCVSKQFQCPEKSSSILAFQCLMSHPDFVVLITSGADFYTWNVVEETICHHLNLPTHFSKPYDWFHLSYNGNIIIMTVDKTINLLSSQDGKLGVLHAPSTILHQHLTKDGKYLLYVCYTDQHGCDCNFHSNPVLNLIKVFNGENLETCHLGKMPSAMTVSEDDSTVCVGFEDGTLGLYSIDEMLDSSKKMRNDFSSLTIKESQSDLKVKIYKSKTSPNILWMDCMSTDSNES
ncbi:NACHT and WD repeat domain-containing protein 2-like [Discoglossus pictus]